MFAPCFVPAGAARGRTGSPKARLLCSRTTCQLSLLLLPKALETFHSFITKIYSLYSCCRFMKPKYEKQQKEREIYI